MKIAKKTKQISKILRRHSKILAKHAKDHFIPHKGNNHHPHVLKHHVLFGYSAIVVLIKVLVIAVSVVYPRMDLSAIAITSQNLIDLTNRARTEVGLQALNYNAQLSASAQAKANDMLKNQYFAHNSPDGKTPWYWIGRNGYKYVKSGENLAVHYSQAEDVEAGWIASVEHKRQILDPDYIDVGVGVTQGVFEGTETYFVVQHFGEPLRLSEPSVDIVLPAQMQATTSVAAVPQAQVFVKPTVKGANIRVNDKKAVAVTATLGKNTVDLKNEGNGKWVGEVEAKAIADAPQVLAVVTEDKTGATSVSADLVLGVNNTPVDLYGPQKPQIRQDKLFGIFTSDQIDYLAHSVFVFLLIFLSASLLLYIFGRLHVKKVLVIGHALSVIGLIVFLSVI